MEKSNILLIGINYAPEPTGIGKYTGELGAALAARGMQVSVVTGVPYYPQWQVAKGYRRYWFSRETLAGALVYRCPLFVPAKPSGAKRMLQDAGFFLASVAMLTWLRLRGLKAQRVFVASPSLFSGLAGLWYRLLYPKASLAYHVQDLQVDAAEELGMVRNRAVLGAVKAVERFILRRADLVSTISPQMAARISAKGVSLRHPVVIFPNWASTDGLFPTTPDPAILEGLGIDPHKPYTFYSGAMGEKQGLELILAVAQSLAHTNWQFVLAGSGPYAEKLELQAKQQGLTNVLFLPLQPMERFSHLLLAAALHWVVQKETAADLVLPSKFTNILAVGGLAIVTASPGTALYEMVQTHRMALLIPPGDAGAAKECLLKWEAGNIPVNEYRKAALAYAATYLHRGSVMGAYLRNWDSLRHGY